MFTGIIRHVGTVREIRQTQAGRRLVIDVGPLAAGLALGDSLAVDGVCLTAAAISGSVGEFDAIHETLSRTTLAHLARGARVNLEPALRLGQGLDGHLVQGHVDGMARLTKIHKGGQCEIEFAATRDLTDLMVPKGSVAINGVSLTLVRAEAERFSVALIPTTLADTTLGQLAVGKEANIETDVIGKYVRKYLLGTASQGGSLTLEKLKEHGFA